MFRGNILLFLLLIHRKKEIKSVPVGKEDACTCGKQAPSEMNLISGGEDAGPQEFPWMVRIVGGCGGGGFHINGIGGMGYSHFGTI